jgi:hypothetical protein
MDDDLGYNEDFSDDARVDEEYARFKEEHGAELAQEDLNEEVLDYIIQAHEQRWDVVRDEINRGDARVGEGALDEGLFHIYRALEGYIAYVLSTPVREVFVSRFNRSLPSTERTEKDLFKAAYGAATAMVFAAFGVAVVAAKYKQPDALVEAFEAFKGQWKRRNDLFHDVRAASRDDVERAQVFANGPFMMLGDLVERIADDRRQERLQYWLTPARVAVLRCLVSGYDEDSEKFISDEDLGSGEDIGPRTELLRRLAGEGFVDEGGHVFGREWRLTKKGRHHVREDLMPLLERQA